MLYSRKVRGDKMKRLILMIPAVILFITIAVVGIGKIMPPKTNATLSDNANLPDANFTDCKVEVLDVTSGIPLGELNSQDTKYFISIMKAMELSGEIKEHHLVAPGSYNNEYLITLSGGEKVYFGQGVGTNEDSSNYCFVYINGKSYGINNPAVLNALYVIKENFSFYNK